MMVESVERERGSQKIVLGTAIRGRFLGDSFGLVAANGKLSSEMKLDCPRTY